MIVSIAMQPQAESELTIRLTQDALRKLESLR